MGPVLMTAMTTGLTSTMSLTGSHGISRTLRRKFFCRVGSLDAQNPFAQAAPAFAPPQTFGLITGGVTIGCPHEDRFLGSNWILIFVLQLNFSIKMHQRIEKCMKFDTTCKNIIYNEYS
jgi:hypothetical protein